jgi:hypothetical protein
MSALTLSSPAYTTTAAQPRVRHTTRRPRLVNPAGPADRTESHERSDRGRPPASAPPRPPPPNPPVHFLSGCAAAAAALRRRRLRLVGLRDRPLALLGVGLGAGGGRASRGIGRVDGALRLLLRRGSRGVGVGRHALGALLRRGARVGRARLCGAGLWLGRWSARRVGGGTRGSDCWRRRVGREALPLLLLRLGRVLRREQLDQRVVPLVAAGMQNERVGGAAAPAQRWPGVSAVDVAGVKWLRKHGRLRRVRRAGAGAAQQGAWAGAGGRGGRRGYSE